MERPPPEGRRECFDPDRPPLMFFDRPVGAFEGPLPLLVRRPLLLPPPFERRVAPSPGPPPPPPPPPTPFERRVLPPLGPRVSDPPRLLGVVERLVRTLPPAPVSFLPGFSPPVERFETEEIFLERPSGLRRPPERAVPPPRKPLPPLPLPLLLPCLSFFWRRAIASRTRQSKMQRQQMRRMRARAMIRPMTRAFSEEKKMLKN